MNILITGATGMVGRAVLRAALADPEIAQVTALVRRDIPTRNAKLQVVLHQDFLNYAAMGDLLSRQDAVLWCLGVSQTRVKSEEEYHRVTYEYAVEFDRALLSANTRALFLFLSGAGADLKEKSRTLFARIKGKTENALTRAHEGKPNKLFVFRPGAITPGPEGNPSGPFMERMLYPLHPLLRMIAPQFVIKADELARSMVLVAKHGAPHQILGNSDLVAMSM